LNINRFLFVLFWTFTMCLSLILAIITGHEHFSAFIIYLCFVLGFVHVFWFNSFELSAITMSIFSYTLILTVHHEYYVLGFFFFCASILFTFLVLDIFTIGQWIFLAFCIAAALIYIYIYGIIFAPNDLLKLAVEILIATLPIIIFKIHSK
jgi:hypothetical protein